MGFKMEEAVASCMTTREDTSDGPASERRERPTDDEIERLFGSLPHVQVSQVGDDVRGDSETCSDDVRSDETET